MERSLIRRAALAALRVRLAGERIPLACRILVDRRCASRCLYCRQPEGRGAPLGTDSLLGILDELASIGCLRVSFSGGEPMLHPEIGRLVDRCSRLGMAPEMNTSGTRFAERVGEIAGIELVKLSLDGPEEVHDLVRGAKGAHRDALGALRAARERGIKTVLVTTITRLNLAHLRYVLDLAHDHGALVAFQPIKPYREGMEGIEDLLPRPDEMRRAVAGLREALSNGYEGTMRNSAVALEHISEWPRYGRLKCWAGRIFCVIGPDGTVYPCDRTRIGEPLPNCTEGGGLRQALRRLPDPKCDGCGFCGALELNFAMGLRWRGVRTVLARLV